MLTKRGRVSSRFPCVNLVVEKSYEEAFQNLLRCYLLFSGSLESLIQEKGDATERKDFIVKNRKIYFFF